MKKQTTTPDLLDRGIEIWKAFEMDTYVAFSIDEVKEEAERTHGVRPETSDLERVPRSQWSRKLINHFEEPYQPRYTYEQTICMMVDKGWDGKATIICTKEY